MIFSNALKYQATCCRRINIAQDVYRVAFNLSVLGFRPNNGYTTYYKLDGIDDEYNIATDDSSKTPITPMMTSCLFIL